VALVAVKSASPVCSSQRRPHRISSRNASGAYFSPLHLQEGFPRDRMIGGRHSFSSSSAAGHSVSETFQPQVSAARHSPFGGFPSAAELAPPCPGHFRSGRDDSSLQQCPECYGDALRPISLPSCLLRQPAVRHCGNCSSPEPSRTVAASIIPRNTVWFPTAVTPLWGWGLACGLMFKGLRRAACRSPAR
jgi:hypothetical protein